MYKLNGFGNDGLKNRLAASAHVGALTASNIMQLVVTLILTILLGRSAGPNELGQLALAMAAASVMQSISVAGLVSVAVAALLKPGNSRPHELRNVFYARVVIVPIIFLLGGFSVSYFPGINNIHGGVLAAFFAGYAFGSFDVANISHTAAGRFQTIAWRRIGVLFLTGPVAFWFAHKGELEATLLLLGLQATLWQTVLIPGADLKMDTCANIRDQWKGALANVWNVRSLWAASIFGSVAQRIDLFIVSALLGVHAAGQYSTASRPVEATTVVAGSLITVLFNGMASSAHDPIAHSHSLAKSARTMFGISCTLTALLVITGPTLLTTLYGEEFSPAGELIGLYALSIIFIFQKRLLDRIAVLQNAYVYNLTASISTIIINIVLNLLLIPTWGLHGAAAAAVLTHPFSLITSFCVTRRGRIMLGMGYGAIFCRQKSLHKIVVLASNERQHVTINK